MRSRRKTAARSGESREPGWPSRSSTRLIVNHLVDASRYCVAADSVVPRPLARQQNTDW
jgi:hypothetical protein